MATFLITQATGQQSQSVIKHLLEAGDKVHALVRDVQKVPPILQQPGVKVFQGESKSFDDVLLAALGCSGAFLNTVPIPGLEKLQAETIIAACQKAGIRHVVAATTFMTNNRHLWDNEATKAMQLDGYYESKAAIEAAVRAAGFGAYTILRPAVIHHDVFTPGAAANFPRLASEATLDSLLADGAGLPLTDCRDIGRYAAAALRDPPAFDGAEIDLARDVLSLDQVRDVLNRVAGRDDVRVVRWSSPADLAAASHFVFGQAFQLWANIHDFSGVAAAAQDVEAKYGIPLTSFEAAVQRDKARLLETLPAKQ